MPNPRNTFAAIALAVITLTQPGCLFGSHSKVTTTGNAVAVSTFNQIEPGKSTGAFAKGVLGEPDSTKALEDGSEIWRWSYTEKREEAGYVFLIFGGSNEKTVTKSAYVQVKQGTVVKTWRE
jgi:hypothetical protein